jgi:hypothetical protein
MGRGLGGGGVEEGPNPFSPSVSVLNKKQGFQLCVGAWWVPQYGMFAHLLGAV